MKLNKIRSKVLDMPRLSKRLFVIGIDIALAIFSVWIAYYLRIGEFVPLFERYNEHYPVTACVLSVAIFLPVFFILEIYNEIFHFSGA